MRTKLYGRIFRNRAFRRGGSSIFACAGRTFELAPALLFLLLLLREFSLSLPKLVIGSGQNCSFRWLFPMPPEEALCGLRLNAIEFSSHENRFALVAVLRRKTPLAGCAFAQRNPFVIAYRIEGAGTKRFVAQELLLFKGSSSGGRTRRFLV